MGTHLHKIQTSTPKVIIRYFSFQKAFADERGVLLMPKVTGWHWRSASPSHVEQLSINGYVGLKFITKKQ
jgi:hypothetical protein